MKQSTRKLAGKLAFARTQTRLAMFDIGQREPRHGPSLVSRRVLAEHHRKSRKRIGSSKYRAMLKQWTRSF